MTKRAEPLKGLNLGGWLVLERWMTPSLFKGSQARDELSLTLDRGADVIRRHRKNFISEDDFRWMSEQGIEVIRVPVGYWILRDQDGYTSSPEILDWCFDMAEKYGLKVLLSLHAAPGAQNSARHGGGAKGVQPRWFSRSNRQRTTDVLLDLARRYGQRPGLWGLSVLNEPEGSTPMRYLKLRFWSRRVSIALKQVFPPDVRVVISDSYALGVWYRANKGDTLDVHHYQCYSQADKDLKTTKDHLDRLVRTWIGNRLLLGSRSYIIGEWSAVLPRHVDPSDEEKQSYIAGQLENFKEAEAQFYWSYKTETAGRWSYRDMVELGFRF